MIVCIILLGFCLIRVPVASAASPSPGGSTPWSCHPEDVLLSILSFPDGVLRSRDLPPDARRPAGRAAPVHKFVRGVNRGSRYEARLSLVKEGVVMHQEWLHFLGAVAEDDKAQRITFAVPPLPAGRYTERLAIYDACGLTASLSASAEDDQQLRLLAGLSQVRDVEEPVGNWFCERADEGLVNGSEDFARSSRHASPKSVHIHRSRTGQETGHDKSRDGPYETGFFDAMSIDARSPDSLLYHDDKSFHGAGSSLALHQVSFDTVLGLF